MGLLLSFYHRSATKVETAMTVWNYPDANICNVTRPKILWPLSSSCSGYVISPGGICTSWFTPAFKKRRIVPLSPWPSVNAYAWHKKRNLPFSVPTTSSLRFSLSAACLYILHHAFTRKLQNKYWSERKSVSTWGPMCFQGPNPNLKLTQFVLREKKDTAKA